MDKGLLEILACPQCHAAIREADHKRLVCLGCGENYEVRGEIPIMLDPRSRAIMEEKQDSGGEVYLKYEQAVENPPSISPLKRVVDTVFYGLEGLGQRLRKQIHANPGLRSERKGNGSLFTWAGEETRVLNIGGGPKRFSSQELVLDIAPFAHVDVVGDGHRLPFLDNSLHSIICTAVLEHVEYPQKIVAESFRVLKDGGILYAEFPFILPFHALPADFHRFTQQGVELLCQDFEKIEADICVGPASALAGVLQEFTNIIVPIPANKRLSILRNLLVYVGLAAIIWPVKYLDLLLKDNDRAHRLACGIYFKGRKVAGEAQNPNLGKQL